MIELKNIERSYRTGHTETWVLRRVGLTIREGEFVTVMGPSGAGKSSLLNVLALLDDGWLGEYWFDETTAHKLLLSAGKLIWIEILLGHNLKAVENVGNHSLALFGRQVLVTQG